MNVKLIHTSQMVGNRPYAALLYLGYKPIPESVYKDSYYVGVYGHIWNIHKMYASNDLMLIIVKERH